MNKIDKIVYINLDFRKDRNEQILNEFIKMGICIGNDINKVERFNAIQNLEYGGIGCGQSHMEVIKKYMLDRHDLQNILIVEDDLTFIVNKDVLNAKLNSLLDNFPNYDICLLSRNMKKFAQTHIPSILKVYNSQTTSCYLLNKKFAQTLYDNFSEAIHNLIKNPKDTKNISMYCIDQYWKKLQTDDNNIFTFDIPIAKQRPSYSDIEKKIVNYNC